jgi:hypothetical protein
MDALEVNINDRVRTEAVAGGNTAFWNDFASRCDRRMVDEAGGTGALVFQTPARCNELVTGYEGAASVCSSPSEGDTGNV